LKLRIDDKAMTWNATIGTHRVSGHARLEGDFPYGCEGTLRVPDLPQYVDLVAPDFDIESGSLTAAFEVRGSLLRLRESAGTMTLSQLLTVRSDLPSENDGPAQASFGPEGIRTERRTMRATYRPERVPCGRAGHDNAERAHGSGR